MDDSEQRADRRLHFVILQRLHIARLCTVDPSLDQRHHQFVKHPWEIHSSNQRTRTGCSNFGNRPIVDGQVRLPVQARRVDDTVRRGRVPVESQRPGSP